MQALEIGHVITSRGIWAGLRWLDRPASKCYGVPISSALIGTYAAGPFLRLVNRSGPLKRSSEEQTVRLFEALGRWVRFELADSRPYRG